MKPIIVDMKDMSDSTEIYDSKPNRLLVWTIYLLALILFACFLWMSFSKIEIVVKSNGVFRGDSAVHEISSGVTGNINEVFVRNGQFVEAGDTLYMISIESLSETILRYQENLQAADDRIEILSAYEKSLQGGKNELDKCANNPYYEEFVNRRNLLFASIDVNENDTKRQIALYQGDISSITDAMSIYKVKIEKLKVVKQCIISRSNTFGTDDSVYYSMINSYISTYNYTATQYDNKLSEYQSEIDKCSEQILSVENDADTDNGTLETLKIRIESLQDAKTLVENEKVQALSSLEAQQIASIEQQISDYNDTLTSLNTNLLSAKLQLETINNQDADTSRSVAIMTEKGNVTSEKLQCETERKEYEAYLKSYDIQNDKCIVKANATGYFYISKDLKSGSFIQEGLSLGTIYPENESKYYAEIYVENSDIAKVQIGQKVKFEIAAYPSSEYGYFEGQIESIAKDISIDQSTGYSYFLVKVRCGNVTLKDKDGEEVNLMNGMACQAKIVIDERNVLRYLLQKIDILD